MRCTAPTANGIPIATTDLPVLRETDLMSGVKIINVESTKIGMATIYPATAIAQSSFSYQQT